MDKWVTSKPTKIGWKHSEKNIKWRGMSPQGDS